MDTVRQDAATVAHSGSAIRDVQTTALSLANRPVIDTSGASDYGRPAPNPGGSVRLPGPPVALPSQCGQRQPEVKPVTIDPGCTGGSPKLSQLQWQSWGTGNAIAAGRASLRVCNPDCPHGRYINTSARLTAFRVRRCGSRRVYSRLRTTYPGGPPDRPGSYVFDLRCEDGSEPALPTLDRVPAAPTSGAGVVNRCGDLSTTGKAVTGLGGYGVTCAEARRLARAEFDLESSSCGGLSSCAVNGYRCTKQGRGLDKISITCVAGRKRVTFQG